MNIHDEHVLIEKAKQDVHSFALLYDQYYPRVLRFCRYHTNSRADAEDITSTVFLKAIQSLSKFNWHGYTFGAFLFKIARHECIRLSTRKYSIPFSSVYHGSSLQDTEEKSIEPIDTIAYESELQWQQAVDFQTLLTMLKENLQPDEFDLITLRFFEERSYAELSVLFDKKEGAIRTWLSRIVQKIRIFLPSDFSPL